MKPEQLALAAHVDQIVRNAGEVKGESDDHHRIESNDHPRRDIGRVDCTGWTVCASCSARRVNLAAQMVLQMRLVGFLTAVSRGAAAIMIVYRLYGER
jgi:hypothetical protein